MSGGVTVDTAAESDTKIRFNRPTLAGQELSYIREVVEQGHTAAGGMFSNRAAGILQEHFGAESVLLTTSCTDALEMAALLLSIEPGDTVIVPSFTFVSTALAFARAGARLVFADIEPETLGLDPLSVEQLLDPSVRAVVPVHYAGVGCRIEQLLAVLEGTDVDVIEDNAHGLFGTAGDRPLGTFGRFSTLSFHETKNFVCGEGGALIVNRPDDVDRARILLDKGTNRQAFMVGEVDKYSWVDTGSSFGMADILAAYLTAQLEARDQILATRRRVYDRYFANLLPDADRLGIRLPVVPDTRRSAYHMFHVLLPTQAMRDNVLEGLRSRGIFATFHYVPLHSSEGGRQFAARWTDCPVTDDVSGRLLRLPFHNALSDDDVDRVCGAIVEVMEDEVGAMAVAGRRRPTPVVAR
jgi:dTDP-4-amino-4,6-dideoxygalactose transaminase